MEIIAMRRASKINVIINWVKNIFLNWIKSIFWKKVRYEELIRGYRPIFYGRVIDLPYKAYIIYALYPFNYFAIFCISFVFEYANENQKKVLT